SALSYSLFNSDNTNTEWVTKPVLELALLSLTNRSTEDLVAACLGKQTSTSEDSGKDKKEKGFVSPDKQVCASRYIGEMLICFAFRGIQQCKDILQVMLREVEENKEKDKNELQLQLDCFIANPYKPVREDFSVTLSHLVRSLRLKNEKAMQLFDPVHSLSEFTHLIESIERRYVHYYQLQIKENEQTLKSESSDIVEKKTEHETTSTNSKEEDQQYTKKFDQLVQTLGFWVLHLFRGGHVMTFAPLLIRLLPLLLPAQHRKDSFT
ncbi:hypothetical protein RFI_38177, partial [Reticulomyxa filosa]